MSRTISRRVQYIFFWTYALSILLVLLAAWLFLEDLEKASLEMDKQAELERLQNLFSKEEVVHIQSAMLTLAYLPRGTSEVEKLPVIFRNLPIPFDDEVEFLNKEFAVSIHPYPQGTYYIAKDLSLFTERESLMVNGLIALAVAVIVISFLLSVFISRMISKPIQQLTSDTSSISESGSNKRLSTSYSDAELNDISSSFNHYLDQLDHLIERERSMISMASHELRTPIAVILGAAEIIDRRQQLQTNDRKTLQRISASAQVMSDNVQALLELVRQKKSSSTWETFSLAELTAQVRLDLMDSDPSAGNRIELLSDGDVRLAANKTMVRILLNNLIGNGLNHNRGKVLIELKPHYFEIRNSDTGQTEPHAGNSNASSSTGLGLYIVTLICDYLGWDFSLQSDPSSGTVVRVSYHSG